MLRQFLVRIHRWLGLFAAVFLFISGLTGAVISWDHELDEWLNPTLFEAKNGDARQRPALELAAQLEARDPRVRVTWVPLTVEPGHTLGIGVSPRIDPATGKPFTLDFNQMAIDPATGEVQGQRFWGAVSLSRENLLPFLYKLHYSMHLPDGFGIELGILFMGIVAIVWALDCFIALWISFPRWASWRKSFVVRWKKGGCALTFDLHRSGGVWVWLLLLMLAVTAVSMNLDREVMRPVVSLFSTLTPSPFATRTPQPPDAPIEPTISREQALALAQAEAKRRGLDAPQGGVFYSPDFGVYGVGFFAPGHEHGDGGLGNPWLYFDALTGESAGAEIPGAGSAGDIFLQAQFPLHSGRILGTPGRVLISAIGLAVAVLSSTGVLIWSRKRAARSRYRREVRGDPGMQPSVP